MLTRIYYNEPCERSEDTMAFCPFTGLPIGYPETSRSLNKRVRLQYFGYDYVLLKMQFADFQQGKMSKSNLVFEIAKYQQRNGIKFPEPHTVSY